jgi:hypothetical protein
MLNASLADIVVSPSLDGGDDAISSSTAPDTVARVGPASAGAAIVVVGVRISAAQFSVHQGLLKTPPQPSGTPPGAIFCYQNILSTE